MKLSEIKPSENLKILVCGSAGTGKTCFAASMPYPILYLDFDGKVNSAAAWHSKDKERLENIDVRNLARKLTDVDPVKEMLTIIEKELIPQQNGEIKYKTLVIDSITTFSNAVLNHIIKTNPGIKRVTSAQGFQPCQQDFGILKREFAKLIPGLLSLPMNVVMLGHIKIDKNDLTGEIIRGPMMDGSFGQELPIYFEEAYRSYMKDGKPMVQTKSDQYFEFCRSQIPGLPATVELNYQNLIKKYV
jgi:hypothetical protein